MRVAPRPEAGSTLFRWRDRRGRGDHGRTTTQWAGPQEAEECEQEAAGLMEETKEPSAVGIQSLSAYVPRKAPPGKLSSRDGREVENE